MQNIMAIGFEKGKQKGSKNEIPKVQISKAFDGAVFPYGAVRRGAVRFNRTAPHRTILPLTKPHRTAP